MTEEEYIAQGDRIRQFLWRVLDFNPDTQEVKCKFCEKRHAARSSTDKDAFVLGVVSFYRGHYACNPAARCGCHIAGLHKETI